MKDDHTMIKLASTIKLHTETAVDTLLDMASIAIDRPALSSEAAIKCLELAYQAATSRAPVNYERVGEILHHHLALVPRGQSLEVLKQVEQSAQQSGQHGAVPYPVELLEHAVCVAWNYGVFYSHARKADKAESMFSAAMSIAHAVPALGKLRDKLGALYAQIDRTDD